MWNYLFWPLKKHVHKATNLDIFDKNGIKVSCFHEKLSNSSTDKKAKLPIKQNVYTNIFTYYISHIYEVCILQHFNCTFPSIQWYLYPWTPLNVIFGFFLPFLWFWGQQPFWTGLKCITHNYILLCQFIAYGTAVKCPLFGGKIE